MKISLVLPVVIIIVVAAIASQLVTPSFTGLIIGNSNTSGHQTDTNNSAADIMPPGAALPASNQSANRTDSGNATGGVSGAGTPANSSADKVLHARSAAPPAPATGGGGASYQPPAPCTPNTVYTDWSPCTNGSQQREWSDGCGGSGIETANCSGFVHVSVEPGEVMLRLNETALLSISVNATTGVYGVAFSLLYNSSSLRLSDVAESGFLKSDGATLFTVIKNDTPGTLDFASTRVENSSVVSGYGTAMSFSVSPLTKGSYSLNITSLDISAVVQTKIGPVVAPVNEKQAFNGSVTVA